ncbi:MAG: hypothetical protein Q9190_000089 [Brigantiaea leucoxantha]
MVLSAQLQTDVNTLAARLSPDARISAPNTAPRWSQYYAPMPGFIVDVATENDVLITVQYCVSQNLSFLAQNGGNGWATTLHGLKKNGILINLAGIRAVTFSSNNTQIRLQGGALVSDVVAAGATANALVVTGICNCIGALGAVLGGGIGNLMGQYGLGVDNLISLNVITPSGKAMVVSPETPSLWFAMRGAGPNFGIVTSAVMKSYPMGSKGLNAWLGPLIFTEKQLEPLIKAIGQLIMQPKMALELVFANSGNSSAPPNIILSIFYHGTEVEGRSAFALFYAVGPIADRTATTSYTNWNSGGDMACVKGGRKPNFGVGLALMDPPTWRAIYNALSTLIQQPGAENSSVLMNSYPLEKAKSYPRASSAYPFRSNLKYNAVFTPVYAEPSFDKTAESFGFRVRNLWRSTSGLPLNATYINNAYGDESLRTVYGQNLQALKSIKTQVDPAKRFNFWFPLS